MSAPRWLKGNGDRLGTALYSGNDYAEAFATAAKANPYFKATGAAQAFAEAKALSDMVLPVHVPTIGMEALLDNFGDDRAEAWETITAYADLHARAAVVAALAKATGQQGGAA